MIADNEHFVSRWDNNPDTFIIEEVQFFLDELEHLELETTCSQMYNQTPHIRLFSKHFLLRQTERTPQSCAGNKPGKRR